jgi:predicted pyridoxine 5'-phosphate oxidase superfamily flavin-nucleotide-binding protein
MSDGELTAFLEEERTVIAATAGHDGWPHLMPLWYVLRPGPDGRPRLWAWTFARSQKVRNLERDARATLQVEAGEAYHELRGVMLRTRATIHRDLPTVLGVGLEVMRRYAGADAATPEAEQALRAQAAKRVALEFAEAGRSTWDHRKLGGTY